jgi:two-component system aerobic respiration control sensor histidine kinase ArcB
VLFVGYLVYRFARKDYPHASTILIVHLLVVLITYGLRTFYLSEVEDNAILKNPWFNVGLLISGIINPLFYCFAMAFLCNEKRAMDLRQLNEQARQDAEVRDLFLSTMSHEMRTPLNGIVGSAQLVMNYAEQPKAKPYCEAIINSAESLNVLIENVLEYAGIEGGKDVLEEQDVDITQWLNNICLTLQPLARQKNIEFAINSQLPKQSCYYFDQQKIRQVLNNLIGNAIKFTDHGYVKLSITILGRDQLSHKIRFSVCDTGPGIPEQDIAKLTQPYVQSQAGKQKGGTGLGLSISDRILNKFGSELSITSQLGKGSEFSFILDLALGELSLVERPAISKNCMQGLSVLLVEDMLLNQKIALEFLANDEHKVTLAKTGEEALACIRQATFDVILLDMNLPDISGLEVLAQVNNSEHSNKQTPVLAFTASLSPDEVKQYLALGISDIVAKPIKLEKLRSLV